MSDHPRNESLQPVAGAMAFLLPGLGHMHLGEKRRGVLILTGVLGLFFGGILVGGISVVDSREGFWWFLGQAGTGPVAFGVDWAHQNLLKVPDTQGGVRTPHPDESPRYTRSLAHVHEIGALFATIAGMLNVICIIDAGWHAPRTRRRRVADTVREGGSR